MSRTVLVTGGTGQLGREVVPLLRAAGHRARVASRRAAPAGTADGAWATVDWDSKAGVSAALDGVDAVIHTASGSPKGERQTIAALVAAALAMPTPPHIVYISIVGVDRIPMVYYKAKLASERALETSGLPYSVLRSTQFHSLPARLLNGLSRLPILLLPKGIRFQSIGLVPVAGRLVELAPGEPQGRVEDIGGPAVRTLPDLAAAYLTSTGRSKRIVQVPLPGSYVGAMRAGENLAPEHATPGQSFEDYLSAVRAGR